MLGYFPHYRVADNHGIVLGLTLHTKDVCGLDIVQDKADRKFILVIESSRRGSLLRKA